MKRKESSIEINVDIKAVESILSDPAGFITNWPYVVRVNTRNGLIAEIMLPRFLFKFRDIYIFEVHSHSMGFIYDGEGKKSTLIVTVNLREWSNHVKGEIEVAYRGRGEFFLGGTLEVLARGIAKSLKELAESSKLIIVSRKTREVTAEVDFSDPMSVANFLAKAKMVHSGLHVIGEGSLFDVLHELMEKAGSEVLYVSGITSDGSKGFKVLVRGSQVLAVEVRASEVRTVKVTDEASAREAIELLSKVSGAYMLNAWVPAGGV